MDARFRIRTREGEELTPRTVEIFSELVRSGVIRGQDLVHDALTGEWVPAGAHPMVRLFQDPLVLDPLARSLDARLADEDQPVPRVSTDGSGQVPASAPRDPATGAVQGEPPAPGPTGTLDLSLVEQPQPSPEDEARAFIARMEAERRADPERPALALHVPLVTSTPSVPGHGYGEGPGAMAGRGLPPSRGTGPMPRPGSPPPAPRPPGGHWGDAPAPLPTYAPAFRRGGGFVTWALVVAVVGGLGALALGLGPGREASSSPGVAEAAMSLRASRGVPASEGEIRALAFRGFLDAVDGIRGRRGLGEVPAVWLEGRYLAGAATYPQVRRYWERALSYAREARDGEMEMSRRAYLAASEEAGVVGPVRSLRLAAASEDFARSAGERREVYQRLETLAEAALNLHDVLVELDGRVTYEPMRGRGVSADPVLEAAGADPAAQAVLEVVLDRVLWALNGTDPDSGVNRSQVSGWLVEALARAGVSGAPPSG